VFAGIGLILLGAGVLAGLVAAWLVFPFLLSLLVLAGKNSSAPTSPLWWHDLLRSLPVGFEK